MYSLLDPSDVPRLPMAVYGELNGVWVLRVVEVVRLLDGGEAHQAQVDPQRHVWLWTADFEWRGGRRAKQQRWVVCGLWPVDSPQLADWS